MAENWEEYRNKIIGLGENSFKKSYYPELQNKIEELEVTKNNFEMIFNNTNDAIIIHDKKGIIFNLNKQAQKLYNISDEEKLLYTIGDISSDKNENSRLSRIWEDVLGKGSMTLEWIAIQIHTGLEFPIQVSVNKTVWDGKLAFVAVIRDFTERKQYEQELILAREKAEESNRLKTAFLQNMSHEIRTPMNAICGFSNLLEDDELSSEKRKNYASIIQNSGKQLLSIVNDILTISSLETKQEKVNVCKVSVNDVLIDLLTIFKQQSINHNISLYTKQGLDDEHAEIYTDKTKVTQVLTNLITNALKFTHEGFIEFGYSYLVDFHGKSMLQFFVKDSGIGIKPDQQHKIFERFRQADLEINKKYGGTGLGLAISKSFIELMGGTIWVDSAPEKGSTFYFTIPYNPVNAFDNKISPLGHSENVKTILVAEDEEYNFLYLEALLNGLNIKIIHTKDGRETVEVCKSNSNIDMILMDIKMPILDGHEAAKLIREFKPDLCMIAQSAYALEHEKEKYGDIFDDYLTKPIDKNDLMQIVRKCIGVY